MFNSYLYDYPAMHTPMEPEDDEIAFYCDNCDDEIYKGNVYEPTHDGKHLCKFCAKGIFLRIAGVDF